MLPLSKYLNGRCGASPSESRALISLAAYLPPWMATCATPGRWSRLIMSPTTNTSGWPGQRQVGVHADPAGPVHRRTGLLAQQLAERAGLHAGRPHLGGGLDAPTGAVLVLDLDAPLVDVDDHRAELDLDAELLQRVLGLLAQRPAERREHLGRRVEQDHPGLARVDPAEVAVQRAVRQLGDLAGHLDAGGARAHDDEGQQPVDLVLVVGELRQLEGAEDAAAQLEGVVDALHAGRELGELVVAEVGLARRPRPRSASRTASR